MFWTYRTAACDSKPYNGPPVRDARGKALSVGVHVRLPIKVADKRRYIVAHVAIELDYDFILGADWHVKFNAMVGTEKHMLLLDRQETIPLEFYATGKQGTSCLAALGPSSANDIERREIERILDEYAPVLRGPSIGYTDLIDHTIEISTRPIKQKYFPVSQKIGKIMHSHVKQMLEDDIIEPSNSCWSSSVVMVEKCED